MKLTTIPEMCELYNLSAKSYNTYTRKAPDFCGLIRKSLHKMKSEVKE